MSKMELFSFLNVPFPFAFGIFINYIVISPHGVIIFFSKCAFSFCLWDLDSPHCYLPTRLIQKTAY